jgi:hypothetical protein
LNKNIGHIKKKKKFIEKKWIKNKKKILKIKKKKKFIEKKLIKKKKKKKKKIYYGII